MPARQNANMATELMRKEKKIRENYFLVGKPDLLFTIAHKNDIFTVGKKPLVSMERGGGPALAKIACATNSRARRVGAGARSVVARRAGGARSWLHTGLAARGAGGARERYRTNSAM